MYAYTHATVRLHFLRVSAWDGEPRPLEDQDIRWQRVGAPDVSPMLPANAPVLAALALPAVMVRVERGTRGASTTGSPTLAERALEERMLVQIREKSMDRQKLQHLLSRALARAQPFGSTRGGEQRLRALSPVRRRAPHGEGADGGRPSARAARLVGASCHDERRAGAGREARRSTTSCVGPVKPTASHPGAKPLGWERFAALVRDRPMPVYAIGGLTRADLPKRGERGAHGVAMPSAAF